MCTHEKQFDWLPQAGPAGVAAAAYVHSENRVLWIVDLRGGGKKHLVVAIAGIKCRWNPDVMEKMSAL